MRKWFTLGGAVAAAIVITGLAAPDAGASTGGNRTVDGCLIVSSPTSTFHTSCPSAHLSAADLSGIDLSDADLHGANLSGADLSGATLTGDDLSGADLTGANLTEAMLDGVKWGNTTCPDGAASDKVGDTCVNDLMVLEGLAVGSTPGDTSSPPGSSSTASTVPSPTHEFSALAFTGFPTWGLATVGFGMVVVGLLLIFTSESRRRNRSSSAAS